MCFQEDDVMYLAPSKEGLAERSHPSFDAGRKLSEIDKALLWQLLNEAPECPSRELLAKVAQRQGLVPVSVRHLNRLRVQWLLNRPKGRPRQAASCPPVASGTEVVRITPRLSFVGVHLFAHWLAYQGLLDTVVEQLTQAIEAYKRAHPSADFALLQHREQTLRRRFQALFLAPLFGIDRLTAFDTHEHPLPTLLGQGYHSSTLSQFLGHLERVGAAEALLPALVPAQAGQIIYVDGHMMAYWSRVPMHKGKITMLGRIMAGSQAVIAHDEAGQALFVAYYPPDVHVSQVIVAYCAQVAEATGTALFVIDRAVNAVAMARAFDDKDLGLLCMLDDNEHRGLESFEATQVDTLEDGTRVYSGPWKEPQPDDPRHFVIVEPVEGKTLVYWATPKVEAIVDVTEWPRVYRARNEVQEHSFKRMIDHGALNTKWPQEDSHSRPASATRQRETRAVTGDGSATGRQEGRGGQSATGPGSRGRVERPWQTSRPASGRLGGVGNGVAGRPAQTRPIGGASPSHGAIWAAGGSRFSQADDHDDSHAFAGKYVAGVHGRAVRDPPNEGECGNHLAPAL